MAKTAKTMDGPFTHWVDYTQAERQPKGGWKSISFGVVRYTTSDGRTLLLETLKKVAYGRTVDEAEIGAKLRAKALIERVLTSVQTITEEVGLASESSG